MRLDKLLSNLGYCSRSEAKDFLRYHQVMSDEMLVQQPSDAVDPDKVTIDGEQIIPPGKLTIILHKPPGFTCSHKDNGRVIYELFPEEYIRRKPLLSSVGRLDKDSSGLLILTDDGDLNHRLTSPKKQTPKRYEVTTAQKLSGKEKELFGSGTMLLTGESKPLLPVQVDYTSEKECIVTLYEGRNRQIRRMFEEIGNEVITLHRVSIGELTLSQLDEGDWHVAEIEDIMLALRP